MKRKNTLLIDGNNLGWMSFGMAPLSYEGQRTEVISIGLSMIRNYISQFDPDKCIVTWDGGLDAERVKLYPEYKRRGKELTKAEKRERDMFFVQMNKLIDVLSKLGIAQYKLVEPRREADDVIYSLIQHADTEEMHTIVSSDKDFFQLFSGRAAVVLYSPIKKMLINKEIAEEMYKIDVKNHFLDYRAMVGDPSDNLPGVKDIGPIKAIWLVNNIIDEDTAVRSDFTPRERRLIDLLSGGYEQFELMKELIKFKLIDQDELNRGRLSDGVRSISQMQEGMMEVCGEYGLARIEADFVSFLRPFEMLWRRKI